MSIAVSVIEDRMISCSRDLEKKHPLLPISDFKAPSK